MASPTLNATGQAPVPGPEVYVGPRPFQTGETLYGRDRETADLVSLLISQRLVLLHSPSGAGKTSLIQANLVPALQAEDFEVLTSRATDNPVPQPIIVRVNREPAPADPPGANRYVLSALLQLELHRPEWQRRPVAELARLSLAEYLDGVIPPAGGGTVGAADEEEGTRPLLLLFDQFEEMLTLDPTDRPAKKEFIRQLGRALCNEGRWALFAIREDHLGPLEPYLPALPTGLTATYHLNLLRAEDAPAAIEKPALAAGVTFADDVVAGLVHDLRQVRVYQPDGTHQLRPGSFVEPVHLQVICQSLWRIKKDTPVITQAHLAELGRGKGTGVDEVLAAYYAERVKEAAGASVSERRIREWFSTQLISAEGVRRLVPVHEAVKFGLTAACLGGLDRAFLIRREDRSGTQWYELAHDRLITPIRADNEAWRAANLNTFQLQAELWSKGDRSRDLLVSGELLEEGGRWAEAHRDSLTDVEAAFLEACREAQKLANREREFQEVREGRVRLIYGAIGGGAALLILLAIAAVLAIYFSSKANTEKQNRVQDAVRNQVDLLLQAKPRVVPQLLADLPRDTPGVHDRLRRVWDEERGSRRMRAGLALLALEPDTVRDELANWMQSVDDLNEMLLIRDALKPHGKELASGLWRQLQGKAEGEKRLRLLVALAAFDPENPAWGTAAETGVEPLLSANPLHLGLWVEALRPVRSAWVPALVAVFRDPKAENRDVAASVLADYVRDDPARLTNLLLDADTRQYAILFPRLEAHRDQALGLLRQERDRLQRPGLSETLPVLGASTVGLLVSPGGEGPLLAASAALIPGRTLSESEGNQLANAAVALARLGEDERTWELLRHSADPTVRSHLVERLKSRGVPATAVMARLEAEKEVSIRRALILALGEYGEDQLPKKEREPWVQRLLEWYQCDPDSGVHGAIDWLLRHGKEGQENRPLDWGQRAELERIDCELACNQPEAGRGWYVNGQGQTMVLIKGPVESLMGSPLSEPGHRSSERLLQRRIGRSYAIASKPVTVEQWERFQAERPKLKTTEIIHYSPVPEGPIIGVTWYEAAQYCNWLSEKEGFPEERCYPVKIEEGMKMVPGYLARTGYRLLSEAEWEHACRVGAVAERYYGSGVELLPRYAWFTGNAQNRTWPVGQKRPNDLGLFDMHGNVWTWCQDPYLSYPSEPDIDKEYKDDITDKFSRVLRGASFYDHASNVRSALREVDRPCNRYYTYGLRVCRTYH